jgi:lipid-A-disaccharide synthase
VKIGIVAGEKSGDYLGAQLIEALCDRYPGASFSGICGPLMQSAGGSSIAPMEKLSIMGLEGLVGSVGEILTIRKRLLRLYKEQPPDLFIGIDAPDFNLVVEARLRKRGIKTVHYVSPTVWAWRGYRIRKIRRAVDLMLTLFPFEADYYHSKGVPVAFVGHPLAETLSPQLRDEEFRESLAGPAEFLVAVLPGSRASEIDRLGRVFAETAVALRARIANLRFVFPMASVELRTQFLEQCEGLDLGDMAIIDGKSQRALSACDFALLASGTAALEAGLLGKPMVVAYRISRIGYWLVRRTLTVKYASMPNHLLATHPVPEFIQEQVTADNLLAACAAYLEDPGLMRRTREDLGRIHPMLHPKSSTVAVDAIAGLFL